MKYTFAVLLALVSILNANDLSSGVYYPFLRVYPDVKSSALGKTAPALVSEPENYGVNPALLAFSQKSAVQTSYLNLIEDIHLGSVSYNSFYKKQPYALSINYLTYGDFDGRDMDGNSIASPSASDLAFKISHGREIFENLSVGLSVSLIYSDLDGASSFGGVFSAGVLYRSRNRGDFALTILNCGTAFSKYLSSDEPETPWQFTAGWSKKLEHLPITATGNYSVMNEDDQYAHGGLIAHFNPNFNARAGYYFALSQAPAFSISDDENKHGMSFGVDFKIDSWKTAFALTPFGKLGTNKQFLITYEFE